MKSTLPLASHIITCRAFLLIIGIWLTSFTLTSCAGTKTISPTVVTLTAQTRDTLIRHHFIHDSVHVSEAKTTQRGQTLSCSFEPPTTERGQSLLGRCAGTEVRIDTVVITRETARFRIIHDSIYLARIDTIPVPTPYEVVREVPKPIPRPVSALAWLGAITILLVLGRFALRLLR